jgi:2'-5' RNA ligase
MPRLRTFIAVELSPRVISRAGDLIDKLRVAEANVNWVRPQQMHLTLKFLGDVADIETPDVCRVVAQVAKKFEPFEIICRGAGAFPDNERPRSLWIGIRDGAEELKELQAAIDEALKRELGYAKEPRGFHPHLTIGRVKHASPTGREDLTRLLVENSDFDADLTVIDELVTFASFLDRKKGPMHEALGTAALGE